MDQLLEQMQGISVVQDLSAMYAFVSCYNLSMYYPNYYASLCDAIEASLSGILGQ